MGRGRIISKHTISDTDDDELDNDWEESVSSELSLHPMCALLTFTPQETSKEETYQTQTSRGALQQSYNDGR